MNHEHKQSDEGEACSGCGTSDCTEHTQQSQAPNGMDRQIAEQEAVARRMVEIDHKILVLSGKGGVGKSTVAANVAASLVMAGNKVGLMDIDIHGPSIPKLLSIKSVPDQGETGSIQPALAFEGLKVMSIGFFLPNRDDAVIWRGPMKYKMIQQFLADVEWGKLDYLVVDSPPGTGDEPLSIAQLIGKVDGAVIVTTPQELAVDDVRRSINFCHKLNVPILGVIENMSGFVCPECGHETPIFKQGGGSAMADQMRVPFLGEVPIDPAIVEASDAGVPYIKQYAESRTAESFRKVIQPLLDLKERKVT